MKNRLPVKDLEIMFENGTKKYVRYKEGAQLYSMGVHAFADLAKECGAVRKINGVCLVNTEIVTEYIEDMFG